MILPCFLFRKRFFLTMRVKSFMAYGSCRKFAPHTPARLSVGCVFRRRHNTTRHNTTQHDTTRHDTTRHNTTQHTYLCLFCTSFFQTSAAQLSSATAKTSDLCLNLSLSLFNSPSPPVHAFLQTRQCSIFPPPQQRPPRIDLLVHIHNQFGSLLHHPQPTSH